MCNYPLIKPVPTIDHAMQSVKPQKASLTQSTPCPDSAMLYTTLYRSVLQSVTFGQIACLQLRGRDGQCIPQSLSHFYNAYRALSSIISHLGIMPQ